VDVDRLYDVALGLYDFDLVLMVAQKSQKDPKEYLPFLANLQTMDTHTQRYTIDAHLGRWDSALTNLAASGEDKLEQVIALMNKHSLYQTALDVSRTKKDEISSYGYSLPLKGIRQKPYPSASSLGYHLARIGKRNLSPAIPSPKREIFSFKILDSEKGVQQKRKCPAISLRGVRRPLVRNRQERGGWVRVPEWRIGCESALVVQRMLEMERSDSRCAHYRNGCRGVAWPGVSPLPPFFVVSLQGLLKMESTHVRISVVRPCVSRMHERTNERMVERTHAHTQSALSLYPL
jgi:hypothetical protein